MSKKKDKTALTPDEVLRVADAHIIRGIDEDDLAAILNVNSGRIAEAVVAIRWAINNHKTIYRHVRRIRQAANKGIAENPDAVHQLEGP